MTRLKETAAPAAGIALAALLTNTAVAVEAAPAPAPVAAAGASADTLSEAGTLNETVVVTGTRAQGRTEATSSVPILVYDSNDLQASGFVDVGRALEAVSPAINMSHSQTSPSAASTRSITMKGLAPDQVLVLVNGKRWQTSSVLVFNNAVGRGSAPYDLGAIPLSAVDHIEVLSDGAAAQYGSDAIAGVVNIILMSNASGGSYAAQSGVTDRGDGWNYDLAGSQGLGLGERGHLSLSADMRYQDKTNRAVPDPRNHNIVDQEVGDPRALDTGAALDAAYAVAPDADVYGSLLVSRRDSVSVPTFRLPGVSVLYPHGFLPEVNPLIWNATGIVGLRAGLGGGFNLDLSNSYGYNRARFDVYNTANAALGATSPTQFYSGTLRYSQDSLNLTLSHDIPAELMPGHLAAGFEYRNELYQILPGDPVSYNRGGAQGFPGFAPRIPVDNSRNAGSAFVDAEADPLRWLTLSGAGRYDHYSDFGSALTWKGSIRAALTERVALRGSVGTGFRAPSLQQQYFSSVVSQINTTGALVRTGTYQVRDPIAVALGATPLRPEKSRNYSAGLIAQPIAGMLLTADWYRIDITDRIILSDQLSGTAVTSILRGYGITDVQQVQFFTNAAHTRTDGYELSGAYTTGLGRATSLKTALQYGRYHTKLLQLQANPVLPTLPLLGTISKGLLVSAQPLDKLTSSVTLSHDPLAFTVNVDRYGQWTSAPLGTLQTFSARTVLDLSASIDLGHHASLRAGALNVTNTYPDLVNGAKAIGLSYGDEAPFGVNGRAYFLGLQVTN
jgi:iron complex outermembrane receptor protein